MQCISHTTWHHCHCNTLCLDKPILYHVCVYSFWSLEETCEASSTWLLHYLIASQHIYNSHPDNVILSGKGRGQSVCFKLSLNGTLLPFGLVCLNTDFLGLVSIKRWQRMLILKLLCMWFTFLPSYEFRFMRILKAQPIIYTGALP